METTKALELAQLANSITVNANGEITIIGTLSSLDVVGTVTADGLTSALGKTALLGNTAFNLNVNNTGASDYNGIWFQGQTSTDTFIGRKAGSDNIIISGANQTDDIVAEFNPNGDISFYEATGTTPKFFWDASAESLGIGNTSPTAPLTIGYSGAEAQIQINNSGGNRMVYLGAFSENEGILRLFNSSNVETVRIPSESTAGVHTYFNAGNVGIGTSSPAHELHVYGSTTVARLEGNSTGVYLNFKDTGGDTVFIGAVGDNAYFETNGSERMRIDSSGNLLVGTTDNNVTNNSGNNPGINLGVAGIKGYIAAARYQGNPLSLNRLDNDGDIVTFQKDGSTVGSIAVQFGTGLKINTQGTLQLESGSNNRYLYFDFDAAPPSLYPEPDNLIDLGRSNRRFDDIYATNGTIQTSDRNEKQDIEALSDAEQRVAVAAKGLLRKYRWKDAVAEKGDAARIHFGIIAQDLQAAFEAEGLDAGRYGMFISSTWTDEETGEERSRMGVRYSELLAFIIAAI